MREAKPMSYIATHRHLRFVYPYVEHFLQNNRCAEEAGKAEPPFVYPTLTLKACRNSRHEREVVFYHGTFLYRTLFVFVLDIMSLFEGLWML